LVGVILFRVAAVVYRQTHFVVSSALAIESTGLTTISGGANSTPRRVVGQWGGAGGAVYEDHRPVAGGALSLAACEEKKKFSSDFFANKRVFSQLCDLSYHQFKYSQS
jgi:hypothetical protein